MASITAQTPTKMGWSIGLWTAQVALAGMFALSGYMHVATAPEALVQMGMAWAGDAPVWLIRFIGIAELAGAVGVILPALTRILPALTPLAALGLGTIQVLALGLHVSRQEWGPPAMNAVLIAIALFVVWGRFSKAPVASRN